MSNSLSHVLIENVLVGEVVIVEVSLELSDVEVAIPRVIGNHKAVGLGRFGNHKNLESFATVSCEGIGQVTNIKPRHILLGYYITSFVIEVNTVLGLQLFFTHNFDVLLKSQGSWIYGWWVVVPKCVLYHSVELLTAKLIGLKLNVVNFLAPDMAVLVVVRNTCHRVAVVTVATFSGLLGSGLFVRALVNVAWVLFVVVKGHLLVHNCLIVVDVVLWSLIIIWV